ncbi:hypothetical protein V8C40DRAFT_53533 [Trichoderma camerunense]
MILRVRFRLLVFRVLVFRASTVPCPTPPRRSSELSSSVILPLIDQPRQLSPAAENHSRQLDGRRPITASRLPAVHTQKRQTPRFPAK